MAKTKAKVIKAPNDMKLEIDVGIFLAENRGITVRGVALTPSFGSPSRLEHYTALIIYDEPDNTRSTPGFETRSEELGAARV